MTIDKDQRCPPRREAEWAKTGINCNYRAEIRSSEELPDRLTGLTALGMTHGGKPETTLRFLVRLDSPHNYHKVWPLVHWLHHIG